MLGLDLKVTAYIQAKISDLALNQPRFQFRDLSSFEGSKTTPFEAFQTSKLQTDLQILSSKLIAWRRKQILLAKNLCIVQGKEKNKKKLRSPEEELHMATAQTERERAHTRRMQTHMP